MCEAITTEFLVLTGLFGVDVLVFLAAFVMLRTPHEEDREIDIEAAIRDAPYHKLKELEKEPHANCCPDDGHRP